jgi:hypothetical protein
LAEFYLTPPLGLVLLDWGVLGFLVVTILVLAFRSKGIQRLLGLVITGAVMAGWVYLSFIPAQPRVVVGEVLEVHTPPYARVTAAPAEILGAFVVDWRDERSFRPKWRTGGVAFGGYRVGRFKLENGSPAVIMASGTKVLVIELEDKYLLLAPDDFDGLVAEVNRRFVPVTGQ